MTRSTIKVWSTGELAEHTFERPVFLIDPLIPLGGKVLLHGKPGVGKSQLSLSLSDSIVNGTPFMDKFPVYQGPVVQIQVDMTEPLQQLRIHKALTVTQLDNLFWVFPEVFNIVQLNRRSQIVEDINEIDPVLIIWDTLRKIHYLNESASETSQIIYSKAKYLFPRATHQFNHHDRKDVIDQSQLRRDEGFRGSGDWTGSADTSMQLVDLDESKSPNRMVLHFHKCRTAPRFEKAPLIVEMNPDTMMIHPVLSSPFYTNMEKLRD